MQALDAHHLADAGDELCGHDRVAPQLGEIVVDAHAIETKHLGPESRQDLL